MRKKRIIRFFFASMVLLILLSGCKKNEEVIELEEFSEESEGKSDENAEQSGSTADEQTELAESISIYIHVCGFVNNPGVYELKSGDRYYNAIEAAGGFSENADSAAVNLAQIAEDGVRLYVPSLDEDIDVSDSIGSEAASVSDGKVNINTASREELMTLTGIGESKADDIIRYREENGGFKAIEDIMKISGIKEGVFNKIKEQIKI